MRLIVSVLVVTFLCMFRQGNSVQLKNFLINREAVITRSDDEWQGCSDPTEPFNCPGSKTCISIQFICDGIAGDCPNNYDEDPGLCCALHRPPADTIVRFLSTQYENHGEPFIVYLFGKKAAQLFKKMSPVDAFQIVAKYLAVSPTIKEFCEKMEMSDVEEKRLHMTLEKVNTGQVGNMPQFVKDSVREGLSSLVDNLKKTHFIN